MQQYLEIGQIVSVQGIHGEVRVNTWSDSPSDLTEFTTLYFDKGATPISIENARVQKNVAIIKLEGIETIEQAQALRNKILYIDRSEVKLSEDTYFIQDLIGLKVIDNENNDIVYGELIEVSPTGANDVYHIKSENGKMYYIPAIKKVVNETNIKDGVMKITPLKGLFEDE